MAGAATLSTMESHARMFQLDASQDHSVAADPGQALRSPESMDEQFLPPDVRTPADDESMPDFDDSSFADFLRDVMMPATPSALIDPTLDFMNPSQSSRDVFDFGMDTSLDFTDMDFGWIDSQNTSGPVNFNFSVFPDSVIGQELNGGQKTPDVSTGINLSTVAFEKSLWLWAPNPTDTAYAQQGNLSLPRKDMIPLEARLGPDLLDQRLEQNSRDNILAMLLKTCEPGNVSRVVTSFPSADLLDSLIHLFFRSELSQIDSWIHLPTFRPQSQRPEFNGIIIAAGAIQSAIPTVQKLGFAIQEAVRMALPKIVSTHLAQKLLC